SRPRELRGIDPGRDELRLPLFCVHVFFRSVDGDLLKCFNGACGNAGVRRDEARLGDLSRGDGRGRLFLWCHEKFPFRVLVSSVTLMRGVIPASTWSLAF